MTSVGVACEENLLQDSDTAGILEKLLLMQSGECGGLDDQGEKENAAVSNVTGQAAGLNRKASNGNIRAYLNTLKYDTISDLVKLCCSGQRATNEDLINFIKAVFQSSKAEDTLGQSRILLVCKQVIREAVEECSLSDSEAAAVFALLSINCEEGGCISQKSTLPQLIHLFYQLLRKDKVKGWSGFSVVSHMLNIVEDCTSVSSPSSNKVGNCEPDEDASTAASHSITGAQFKDTMINKFCQVRWCSQGTFYMLSLFRDVNLTESQHKFVVSKIIKQLSSLEVDELPPLIYQLLLFASKGNKKQIIEGLVLHFNALDDLDKDTERNCECECDENITRATENLKRIEGTILLHMDFAVKQDHDLGKELLKLIKGPLRTTMFRPFSVGLLLTLSRIHRFQSLVLDLMKTCLITYFRDSENSLRFDWLDTKEFFVRCSIDDVIMETLQNSRFGWDYAIQGLVNLGFMLVDTFAVKAWKTNINPNCPESKAFRLGCCVLSESFKMHESVRTFIVATVVNFLFEKSEACCSVLLDMLCDLVYASPSYFVEEIPKLKDAANIVPSVLSVSLAKKFLDMVSPLLKLHSSLRDSLMVVLRKALFSCDERSRQIAVYGFMVITKHCKVSLLVDQGVSSQNSFALSQGVYRSGRDFSSDEAIALEILCSLKRALSQQLSVRRLIYQNVIKVANNNPGLSKYILDFLFPNLQKYCEDKPNLVILLDKCVPDNADASCFVEPLGDLLLACTLCLRYSTGDQEGELSETSSQLSQGNFKVVYEAICKRLRNIVDVLRTSTMEDFELDKNAEYSDTDDIGRTNKSLAVILLGIYEAAMEVLNFNMPIDSSDAECMVSIFKNYSKLRNVVNEASSSAASSKRKKASSADKSGAKDGKEGSVRFVPPIVPSMSARTTIELLRLALTNPTPSSRRSWQIFQECPSFIMHLLSVQSFYLEAFENMKNAFEDLCLEQFDSRVQFYCTVAKLLLGEFFEYSENPNKEKLSKPEGENLVTDVDGKGIYNVKTIPCTCLSMFVKVLTIMCTYFDKSVPLLLLKPCVPRIASENTENARYIVHESISTFLSLLEKSLSQPAHFLSNVPEHIVEIISLLSLEMASVLSTDDLHEIMEKLYNIFKTNKPSDTPLLKRMLQLLFTIQGRLEVCPSYLLDLATSIHITLGDVSTGEIEITDADSVNPLVCEKSVVCIFESIISQIDTCLSEIEWCIKQMETDILANALTNGRESANIVESASQRNPLKEDSLLTVEANVNQRLLYFTSVLEVLTRCCIYHSPDSIMKCLKNLYTASTLLTKYYGVVYTKQKDKPGPDFTKLADGIGHSLSQHVYSLITFVQVNDIDQTRTEAASGKYKDKKKKASGQKSKIYRESKIIPNLIYSIEQFESQLIQLSTKSKIDLMKNFKRSTTRDFRIQAGEIEQAWARKNASNPASSSSSEDEDESSEPGQNGDERAKKPKLGN
eukprot:Nk52_evm20s2612 gene=Nk52_evmTU20s2612